MNRLSAVSHLGRCRGSVTSPGHAVDVSVPGALSGLLRSERRDLGAAQPSGGAQAGTVPAPGQRNRRRITWPQRNVTAATRVVAAPGRNPLTSVVFSPAVSASEAGKVRPRGLSHQWMAPRATSRTTVTTADSSSEPRHPRRLLKNKNTPTPLRWCSGWCRSAASLSLTPASAHRGADSTCSSVLSA